MTGLDIAFSPAPDGVIVRVDGEIDLTNTAQLSDAILDAFSNRFGLLVLDFTGVRYLDSAGIRALFSIASTLETARQQLAIVVPMDSSIRRLFAITQMETVARVAATVDEVVATREGTPKQPS